MFTMLTTAEFLLTTGIYTSVTIASNLIRSVTYLMSIAHSDNELKNLLITSDVLEDLGVIKVFIEEQKHRDNIPASISVCIENLNTVLIQLEDNLNSITNKIQTHHQKYFNYFRSYNIGEEKKKIPILIEKMHHRFDLLIKINQNHNFKMSATDHYEHKLITNF